jgi:hypothetical protein
MSSPRRPNDNKDTSDTGASDKDAGVPPKKLRLSTTPISTGFLPRALAVPPSSLSIPSISRNEAKFATTTTLATSLTSFSSNQVNFLQINLSEDCKKLRDKFDMIATAASLIAPLCSVRPQTESNLYAISYGLIFSYDNYDWIKNGISKRLYNDNIVELGQKYNFTVPGRRNFEETLLKLKPIRNLLADHFYYLLNSEKYTFEDLTVYFSLEYTLNNFSILKPENANAQTIDDTAINFPGLNELVELANKAKKDTNVSYVKRAELIIKSLDKIKHLSLIPSTDILDKKIFTVAMYIVLAGTCARDMMDAFAKSLPTVVTGSSSTSSAAVPEPTVGNADEEEKPETLRDYIQKQPELNKLLQELRRTRNDLSHSLGMPLSYVTKIVFKFKVTDFENLPNLLRALQEELKPTVPSSTHSQRR